MKTILFGSLTPIHDTLLEAAMINLGYKAKALVQPDIKAFNIGREFCNKGMCNPVYFTVGNLIKFLQEEKSEGVDVEKNYTFLTVGACGPCRFGMYETEYREALKEAGFEKFEIGLLNQTKMASESFIKTDKQFIFTTMKAVILGDLLRDLGYRIRPYEIEKGKTDKVLKQATTTLYNLIRKAPSIKNVIKTLRKIKKDFEQIKVKYYQPKPVVNVIGEFWIQTTESHGNYFIQKWLEEEGAEVKVEPISMWIEYQLFAEIEKIKFEMAAKGISLKKIKKTAVLKALLEFFRCTYETFRTALGNKPRTFPYQKTLWELTKPYYDPFVTGGEGHLEIAKHIFNIKHKEAHMTLSLKPFGCMPSTQSDGVQAKVLSDYPESIFVSVETSGDSEVNVKSRIQMKLFEAKETVIKEVEETLKENNLTEKAILRAIETEPYLQNPFIKLSKRKTATAAKFISAHNREIRRIYGRSLHRKNMSGN